MGYYGERWRELSPWVRIPVYAVFGTAAAVGLGLLFGMVVVWLWNWLMPMIFGLPTITFWQGVGLFVLAKLFFGGVSGSSHSEEKKRCNPPRPPRDRAYGGTMGHGPMDPGPADHDPAQNGPMDRGPARGFENWRYYDEWWHSQGKASFNDYVEQMRPAPTPPPSDAADAAKTEETPETDEP